METLLNPLPKEAAAWDPIRPPPTKVRKIVDTTGHLEAALAIVANHYDVRLAPFPVRREKGRYK
jgi:hypothetical protein